MFEKKYFFLKLLLLVFGFSLNAQTHVSVPLDDSIYYVLEQAQMRGLCPPLPAVKPYSRKVILEAIETMLSAPEGRLSATERDILERARQKFKPPITGLSWSRGAYNFERQLPKVDTRASAEIGVGLQMAFGGGYYLDTEEFAWGTDNLIHIYANGDMGEHFSFGFNFFGGIARAPRKVLGEYDTFYKTFVDNEDAINREIAVYSHPLPFFPYGFKKTWDGGYFVTPGEISSDSGFVAWPDKLGIGPMIISELSGEFFGGAMNYRFGRVRREWGAMAEGRSLILNGTAQPFVGIEGTFNPFPWISFSTLTGVLEYYEEKDAKFSSWTSQNAYSLEQLELNYKDYFHLSLGTSAVWVKRFELGYLLPLQMNFLYQGNIGDFDNMAAFMSLKGQYPGIGKIWFTFWLDEVNPDTFGKKEFWELDRNMYIYQFGTKLSVPRLPFSSIILSYTKNEPYNYTHTRIFVPWANNEFKGQAMPMETAYLNNGESIGYYLQPNSDEILFRFESMPGVNARAHFQYQMVRHGATHGESAVDGSHFLSELDPNGRDSNAILRKYFLHDGAYNWLHIFKIGGEYSLARLNLPICLFGEAGVVYSYYTNTEESANSGAAYSYKIIDTAVYPKSTGVIVNVGFRLFL
ncbi:MAG: hypothetical protein LBI06_00005 [Treponema sp.]|nr:hypothetical protein [Treponema sp.]